MDSAYNTEGCWVTRRLCMFSCGEACDCAPPGDVYYDPRYDKALNPTPLPCGQYWSMQPDGHKMLCNADGTRSIFDDIDK